MRQTRTITIDKEGRDFGKTFQITEMPASRLELWTARALSAVFAGDVPADVAEAAKVSTAAAFAGVLNKVLAGLDWNRVAPLYVELLDCVAFVPNADRPKSVIQLKESNIDNFVEEVPTLFRLRMESLELNLGFFAGAAGLSSLLNPASTREG